MSINIYNPEKQKWIEEYKKLTQNFKNEELDLLKLFLVKNYHLNKVYKKYVYREKTNNYLETQKKLKIEMNELNKEKIEKIKDLINKIKVKYNNEYETLNKEENKIENDLKKFDYNSMILYENDLEEWKKDKKNIFSLNNSDFEKENSSISISDKNEHKHNFNSTNYNSKNYETDLECIKNSFLENKDDKSYSLKYMIESLIDKDKCIKLKELNSFIPNKTNNFIESSENPIKNYIEDISKDISYIFVNKFSSKTMNNFNPMNHSKINGKEDEKTIINNINSYLNKISEDKNIFHYLNKEIKKINKIINEELEGIYLGWTESEHKEFIKLKKLFKDKINSFLFLSNLNNLFPYMTVSKLKKHIKLYSIYIKLKKIKDLLIEKYNSMKTSKNKDIYKSLKQLNTSISVTKSFSYYKINNFDIRRDNYKSLENMKSLKTTNVNNNTLNKTKVKKDYLKISLNKSKDNLFNKDKRKKDMFNNYSLNVIRRRNSNNFFFVPKNK